MGVVLNLADRNDVTAAVDSLTLPSNGVVADVGFGGGIGLRRLLDRVDARGKVHGVEVSSMMLSGAARRFSDEIAAGRLELHRASITELPLGTAVLDGLVTTHTVYFVSELDRAFAEIAHSLKGSGRAVIGLGNPDAMSGFQDYGFRIRAIPEIVQTIERAGLTLTRAARDREGQRAVPHALGGARARPPRELRPRRAGRGLATTGRVRLRGVEPPRALAHRHLKTARLPFRHSRSGAQA